MTGPGHPRGHTGPAGPRLCIAARRGRRRRSRTRGGLRRPLAHPLPTSGGSLRLACRSPPAPRPALSREAPLAWRSAPPGPYFIYDLWGDTTARRRCQHARTTASAERVLFIWVSLAYGLAEGPLRPGGAPRHTRPLHFALGCPRRAPETQRGPHTGQISFFLFSPPTGASCCSQPRNEMKIAPADPEVIVSRGAAASLPPPASPAPASRRAQC